MKRKQLKRGQRRQLVINLRKLELSRRSSNMYSSENSKEDLKNYYVWTFESLRKINEIMEFSYKETTDEEFNTLIERFGIGKISLDEYYELWQNGYAEELEDLWTERRLETTANDRLEYH